MGFHIPICLANVYINHRHGFRRLLRNNVWHGRYVRSYIRVCECGAVLLCGTGADSPDDIGCLVCLVQTAEVKKCGKGVHVDWHRRFGIDWDSADCFCHSCLGYGRYA